jgi:uncharacterized protein (DUF1778 family)
MAIMGNIEHSQRVKTERVEFRVSTAQRDIIARGAQAENKSLSEFVVEHSVQAAELAILDRRTIDIDDEQFEHFQNELGRRARANEGLKDLFSRGSSWQKINK